MNASPVIDVPLRPLDRIKEIHDAMRDRFAAPFHGAEQLRAAGLLAADRLDPAPGSELEIAQRDVAERIEPLVRLGTRLRARIIDHGGQHRLQRLDVEVGRRERFRDLHEVLLERRYAAPGFIVHDRLGFDWWTGSTGREAAATVARQRSGASDPAP